MNMCGVIGRNGNAKSAGIKIKNGERVGREATRRTRRIGGMKEETEGCFNLKNCRTMGLFLWLKAQEADRLAQKFK